MKYGLLVTSPVGPDKNIGDYMQSLAAMQFLPKVDTYIEKENVSFFSYNEEIKAIMNAWYIWHPENWPPKESMLKPLLTSIHIMPSQIEEMLSHGGREYFQKYAPIGCRDTGTMELLQQNGIDAYFSGCLTLTLGMNYSRKYERTGTIFVDPYIPPFHSLSNEGTYWNLWNLFKSLYRFINHPIKILQISKKEFFKRRLRLISIYDASMFYHAYSKMFDDDVLFNSEYITHMVSVSGHDTQEDWLRTSEKLLDKYAHAKYVVTSRIHCALPCLGIDTPVIFVLGDVMKSSKNIIGSPGRYGGLLNLFRVAEFKKGRLSTSDEILTRIGRLFRNSSFNNKSESIRFREKLIQQCKKFINE